MGWVIAYMPLFDSRKETGTVVKPVVHLVEDTFHSDLFPLTYSRPSYELRTGMFTLRERLSRFFGSDEIRHHMRDWVIATFKAVHPDLNTEFVPGEAICINGRVVADAAVAEAITSLRNDECLKSTDGQVVAVRRTVTTREALGRTFDENELSGLSMKTVAATMIRYPWDLIFLNAELIERDARASGNLGKRKGTVSDGAYLHHKENIYIAPGVTVQPGVVIAADKGPVYIDEGAEVMANAAIQGPVYIGKKSIIKMGAKIYGGTFIGDVCKVGGEVEGAIIHGYSNKQHEGFLGHAYIGMWCNLGADTNNSDLKNNYGMVDMIINGKKIDTGKQFMGLVMGDHSKTGINTMFNTGTVVGFSCNVFGAGYLPKYVPSFTWLDSASGPVEYRLDKAIEVAQRVTERRKVAFTAADEQLFTGIFDVTKKERAFSPTA